ncbi:MAG: hypothetical protein MJZ86_04055 [Bacteroidales bacterium]|nr:hypothetical protein [Bacteroidales bacterium]
MKKINIVLLIVMLFAAVSASAQYTQQRPNVEYMLKIEAGYLQNVGNYGKPSIDGVAPNVRPQGYNLNAHEVAFGLNIINGVNISQDFFLGGGVGFSYCLPMLNDPTLQPSPMGQVFVDMDYRPVGDTWAPMVGARLGGSFLMNSNNYGTTMSPYVEIYTGLNWFYDHALQQMDRNYHSFYVEAGVVFQQQTVFIPIRLGWRL